MSWRLLVRQLVGLCLCPVAIVLIVVAGLGEGADALYNRLKDALDDLLGSV